MIDGAELATQLRAFLRVLFAFAERPPPEQPKNTAVIVLKVHAPEPKEPAGGH